MKLRCNNKFHVFREIIAIDDLGTEEMSRKQRIYSDIPCYVRYESPREASKFNKDVELVLHEIYCEKLDDIQRNDTIYLDNTEFEIVGIITRRTFMAITIGLAK